MLTSTICCFVLLQLTQGKYVFLNYSPVIPRSGNSSLVCADLGCRASRSQLSISRMRPWRGGLSARHSSVLGNCGRKVTWYTYLDKAEGAFTCGRNKEKITTFKMNYKGSLRPLNFTRRVNVGERLLLEMKVTNSSKPQFAGVLWYKNRRKFTATSRAWTVRNGLSLVIHNVTMGDAGVYTARYYDETIEAGIVVSVRDCPRNLWSRDCSKRCPVCNNNGECDVTTGLCVCQPGFGGKHCQSACPANYFGPNCTTSCSDVTDDVTCRGVEMCQSIGCNCMSGWTGPDCKEKCPPDRYGAGCTERCLCSNQGTCDRFRGCICPPRWYGTSCKSRIDHKQQTNRYSSHVPLQLKREVSPRIVEIVAVPSSFKVNTGQSAQVRCAVSGLPLPIPGEITVRGNGSRVIKAKKTIVSLNRTTAIFSLGVVSLYPGPYSCVATTISGTASKTFSFNVSALPRPIRAPRLIHQGASRLVIGLNSFPFTGDGPIVRKVVQFKRANETTYNHYDKTIPYNDSIAISALDEYTSYDVRVVLYREGGITGRGKPGPVATFTTKCQVPTAPPVITLIHRIRNSTSVYLVWEIPDARTIRGELKDFTIVIYPIENQLKPVVYDEVDRRRRTAVLKNLSPLQVYGVKMQMANCAGSSPYSKEARVTMGKLDKPQGPKLFLTNLTSTSASYKWETPLNAEPYTIITYEVTFNETFNFSPNAMRLTTNTSLMTYEFDELAPFTSYSLRVRAFNHETAGNYSDVITAVTHEAAPSAPTNLRSSSATSTSVRLLWDPPLMRNGVMRGFQLQMKQEGEQWEGVEIDGNNTSSDVENLKEYSQYRFRVRGFTVASGKWSDVISVTTMSNKPLKPPVIVDVDVITSQSVTIRWTPPDPSPFVGNITSYKVIYTDDLRQTNEHWRTKVVPGDQTSLVIQELRADSVYSFKVAAATRQLSEYSNKITRRTDRLGLPPSPYDVICSNVTSSSAMITWSVRKGFRITFVKIRFLNSGDEDPLLVEIDDEEKQHKLLTSLKPLSGYEIEVIASNYVGESSGNPTLSFRTKLGASSTLDKDNAVVPFVSSMTFKIILGVISLIVIVVIAITVVACRRYASKPQVMYPSQVEMDLRGNTLGSSQGGGFHSRTGTMMSSYSVPSSDSRCPSTYSGQIFPEALILPWENILFEDIPLGVGNFGQVVKAVVQKDNKIIQTAVKMLKDGSTTDDKRDFLAELDTMVRIGHHKNVLSLVGACEHDNAMYLCTEFAPNGNLLQFLRKSRRPEEDDGSYTTLSQNQLLQFASDVAQGMAYLSEKSLIHRDLAARNILLGDHLVCKVADFGLSRGEGVYVKKTVSRLPIRWMAIESLNYNVYTSKSDVWSFGVLLWEIVSLGGTPYCGMSCAELYEKLPTGYRMEKPINCDDEVYALMVQCWKDRPYDRPTFAQLCVALERMCDARSSRNYVNTAIFEDFKFATIDVNEEEG